MSQANCLREERFTSQRSGPGRAKRAREPATGEGLDGENDVLGLISQASESSFFFPSVLDSVRSSSLASFRGE